MATTEYSVLVVDYETAGHSALLEKLNLPVTYLSEPDRMRSALADPERGFSAIFINPAIPRIGGVGAFCEARRIRPATPLFCLNPYTSPILDAQEMARLTVLGATQGALDPERISALRIDKLSDFSRPARKEAVETPASMQDAEFVAVPSSDFLSRLPCPFDVYLKLPSEKYLQIGEAGQPIQLDRALGYIAKGANSFYIKNRSIQACLQYGKLLSRILFANPRIALDFKINQAFSQTQDVLDLFLHGGTSQQHLESAVSLLEQVYGVIHEIKPATHPGGAGAPGIAALLANTKAHDHAVSVTWICGLMAEPLQIESCDAFVSIGLAGLLHDIGLVGLPQSVWHEDEKRMTPEERKIFLTHSERGAESLRQLPEIDTAVIQAIARHHERRSATNIGRMAEIVGLADEFVRRLKIVEGDQTIRRPSQVVIGEMEREIFSSFSYPVVDAFRSLFK